MAVSFLLSVASGAGATPDTDGAFGSAGGMVAEGMAEPGGFGASGETPANEAGFSAPGGGGTPATEGGLGIETLRSRRGRWSRRRGRNGRRTHSGRWPGRRRNNPGNRWRLRRNGWRHGRTRNRRDSGRLGKWRYRRRRHRRGLRSDRSRRLLNWLGRQVNHRRLARTR